MPNPLFSHYGQRENRVTASILAVFERISFALVERILQILCEEQNIPLLEIRNQIKLTKADSIPDGAIQASFAYWIETKDVQNAIQLDHQLPNGQLVNRQLKAHLDSLETLKNTAQKRLLVLTPDYEEPEAIKKLGSELVSWASFNDLYSAIVDITTVDESWLASAFSPPSEQERFLLRELVQLFQTEGLVNSGRSEAVLIVPAKSAIEDYLNFSVYFCQPKRSFQPVDYIGFYHNGVIDKCIAKILRNPPVEGIVLNEEGIENPTNDFPSDNRLDLLDLVARLRTHKSPRLDQYLKVFFLSSSDSSDTIKLAQDIRNTQKDRSGRPTAFTQGQRYVPLSALQKNPVTTTELLKGSGV